MSIQNVFKFEEEYLLKEISKWEHSETDKGQIYTRPEIVEFMLTAIGLNESDDWENARILEPSCGEGEFVVAIAERFITRSKRKPDVEQLIDKVLAVDLVGSSLDIARSKLHVAFVAYGYAESSVKKLLDNWFLAADFLLEDIEPEFSHVIGNPPYVRVENIPKPLLTEYRKRFSTMIDRADLYVPFFEKSLSLLKPGGTLSFICTDRWTKNTYGRALRKLIAENYSLELFADLYGLDAFERDVMTYPAITQIRKEKRSQTVLIHKPEFTQMEARQTLKAIQGKSSSIETREGIVTGTTPWLLEASEQVALIRKIEHQFPTLEDAGCKVFIGAATGSNKIYIVDKESVDIEESRLLPVITASELKQGVIHWKGKYLVNTYDENGVIHLDAYPKLAGYLESHKEQLCRRHVAKKDASRWYKTIDRVYEERSKQEKLLIPDIGDKPVVVYDQGEFHPNNSIYYICSEEWNLHALRVVLLSIITRAFISAYSTKIAKGYMRFQAQHLRKLRIPLWNSIDNRLKTTLIDAGLSDDTESFNALTYDLYGLTHEERSILGG